MAIHHQVHDKFKVFVGASISDISSQVSAFTGDMSVAAKSIGVEYLDSNGKLIVSFGYRDEQAGYAAKLVSHSAGKLDLNSPDAALKLEQTLNEAASTTGNVICHELYVTEAGDVHTVLLVHA